MCLAKAVDICNGYNVWVQSFLLSIGGIAMSLSQGFSGVLWGLLLFLMAVHLLLVVVVWVSSFSVTEVYRVVGNVCDADHCLS